MKLGETVFEARNSVFIFLAIERNEKRKTKCFVSEFLKIIGGWKKLSLRDNLLGKILL